MDNPLYVRMRGRVLGPYDEEKLKLLVRRGQLSQIHELSEDANNWVRASTFPELFLSDRGALVQQSQPIQTESQNTFAVQTAPAPARGTGQRWWYRKDRAEIGPIDQSTLEQLLACGEVSADSLVWADGMPQWLPARLAPGLSAAPNMSWLSGSVAGTGISAASSEESHKEELPRTLRGAAAGSRPWALFLAIVAFVFAGLLVVSGAYSVVWMAGRRIAPGIAMGLFNIIEGVVWGVGGFLLNSYASKLGGLAYNVKPIALEKAMESLRRFWIFVSIVTIVTLAFLTVVLVMIFSVGVTLPDFS